MVSTNQIVTFELQGQQYALPINEVSEIIRMVEITKTPNSRDYCLGVISLRGSIVPVINLNMRLGLSEKSEVGKDSRIIVIEKNGEKLGLVVDGVRAVTRYDPAKLEEPESAVRDSGNFLHGILHLDNDIAMLLDLDKIMQFEMQR